MCKFTATAREDVRVEWDSLPFEDLQYNLLQNTIYKT